MGSPGGFEGRTGSSSRPGRGDVRVGGGVADAVAGRVRRLAFPRLRPVLPAAMEPEVLVGVASDRGLEGGGEALGEEAGVVGGAGEFVGVDDLGAADLVAEAGADPSRVADGDRGAVLD